MMQLQSNKTLLAILQFLSARNSLPLLRNSNIPCAGTMEDNQENMSPIKKFMKLYHKWNLTKLQVQMALVLHFSNITGI